MVVVTLIVVVVVVVRTSHPRTSPPFLLVARVHPVRLTAAPSSPFSPRSYRTMTLSYTSSRLRAAFRRSRCRRCRRHRYASFFFFRRNRAAPRGILFLRRRPLLEPREKALFSLLSFRHRSFSSSSSSSSSSRKGGGGGVRVVRIVDVFFCRRVFRSHEHERFLLSLCQFDLYLYLVFGVVVVVFDIIIDPKTTFFDDIIIVFKVVVCVPRHHHLCRRRRRFGRARAHVDDVNDVNDVNDETPRVVLVLSFGRVRLRRKAQKVQRQNYVFISSQE